MKRYFPLLACVLGLAALFALLPLFDPPQPRNVRMTREQARAAADAAVRSIGVKVEDTWSVVSWENHGLLEDQFDGKPELRRQAGLDPIVGPRMVAYFIPYFYKGRTKQRAADVYLMPDTGAIIGVRRFVPTEEAAPAFTDEEARRAADRFLASGKLPGVVNPQFDDVRPTVWRNRVDRLVRYRVPNTFPTGKVAMYVGVYFIGNQFAGWMPIEEMADGSQPTGSSFGVIATIFQYGVVFALLLILLIIFLKKYHAGEVGVRTASYLFAMMAVLSIGYNYLAGGAISIGTGLGPGLDGRATAIAFSTFKFIFYDLPVAVLVFFAWAVGESYARERWGERLASYDSILNRDWRNATVGRATLNGLLFAPLVAASVFAAAAIPLLAGWARPTPGGTFEILGRGGPIAPIFTAAIDGARGAVVLLLFIIALFARKRLLPLGFIIAAAVGAIWTIFEVPLDPGHHALLFGFGGVVAAAAIFLWYDLLASATALFYGSLIVAFVPLLRFIDGPMAMMTWSSFAVPIALCLVLSAAGIVTGREIVYEYEDLAPHVKRIIERERVKAEIDAANRIQAALLPQSAPKLSGATVASHYRAATEIGGDYFDFLEQPGGEIGIAFGDVAGHGLTSGIVMSMAKSALLVQVDYDSSPRVVLEVLNDIVIRTAPKRMMMTFFFGLLDARAQTLRFSSAGHLDPYIYRGGTGKLEALSSWGFPLGIRRREGESFREHTVTFDAGDRLILYSDGLIEAVDDDGEPFGFVRFEQTIVAAGRQSADDLKKALLHAVKKFTRNRPPEDDQTLVVVAFDDPVADHVPIRTSELAVAGASETVN
ncbi:MAG TPA: PP2C family protein-serine/threonine phosphatase [Thermoanaerobaculia bacterium]|nr:PP2C family protein-serine/threonine phosphatase [Thermoanaerobaculia bacterium]